jgi:Fe2+ or Zn2+ uptake regulation protein
LSLNTYLAHGSRRGIVWTEQRRLVFRAAWTTDRPFGAYELLKRINEAGGRLHAASVYRCLHLFEAAGLLLPIFSWKRHVLRPALEVDLWAVLLCSNCRSCTLVPLAAEHAATREMLARRGFTGRRYAAECSGLCRSCREGEG